MLFPRPVGGASYAPPADTGAKADAPATGQDAASVGTDLGPGADPLANFTAKHGMHAVLQQRGDQQETPGRDGVPLYDRKQGVSKTKLGETAKSPPPPTVKDHYDVANTPQSDIDALKNATGPDKNRLRRLGHTIEHARDAYRDLTGKTPPAKVVVTTSAGNGGQPVLIITGPKFDPTKPKTVHTHYHGDNATVADPLGSKAGQNARIREVITKEDPQAVFVLPEAQNTTFTVDGPRNNKSQPGVSWANVSDQVRTMNDALKAAKLTFDDKKDKSVVSMHSGGGMAIVHLMKADPSGNNLRADRLELYDCVYHFLIADGKSKTTDSEKYIAAWGNTANGGKCKEVEFFHGGIKKKVAEARAAVYETSFKPGKDGTPRTKMRGMADEPAVNPVAQDSDGNKFRRGDKGPFATNYNSDPHYRTVGQYLGSRSKELRPPPAPVQAPQPTKK
jgi:hypothetical protein